MARSAMVGIPKPRRWPLLWNVNPAERLRPIAVPTQGAEGRRLDLRRVPEDSVHAGGPRTRITDDSQDGQSPATVRVGEQVDQGFGFVPPALPDCLYDSAGAHGRGHTFFQEMEFQSGAWPGPHQQALPPVPYLLCPLSQLAESL